MFKNLTYDMPESKFILATANERYLQKKYNDNTIALKANLQEIRWLYNNCLCVIVPLKYNEHVSGCTTILEAAAMQRPVIVSDVPGIREYIIDGITGIIVPVGDLVAMKNAIIKLSKDKDLAKKMGKNAYNYVKDKFTTDKWAKAHLELSKEIFKV